MKELLERLREKSREGICCESEQNHHPSPPPLLPPYSPQPMKLTFSLAVVSKVCTSMCVYLCVCLCVSDHPRLVTDQSKLL